MQHIVVATDFSNNAYSALFYAKQLLRGSPCTFYLLHVYNEHTPVKTQRLAKDVMEQLRDESYEGLENFYHKIQLDCEDPNHKIQLLSKQGDLMLHLGEIIKRKALNLVVMGNKGSSELKAILAGSNTLRAIDQITDCPILIVPKEIDFKGPKNISFVTAYSRWYTPELFEPLLFFAKLCDAKIRVMQVIAEKELASHQKINRRILLKHLEHVNPSVHWMPLYKSKAFVIREFLKELHIDVLVMARYEHDFLERLTHEPVLKRVAFDLDIPFLIIPCEN